MTYVAYSAYHFLEVTHAEHTVIDLDSRDIHVGDFVQGTAMVQGGQAGVNRLGIVREMKEKQQKETRTARYKRRKR